MVSEGVCLGGEEMTYEELVAWAKELMEVEKSIKGRRQEWRLEDWIEYLKG